MDKNKLKINKENFSQQKPHPELAVKLEDLSFKYFNSEDYIFDNLNLEIKKNSHNIITGPNGSGKSTLLGLISGVLFGKRTGDCIL